MKTISDVVEFLYKQGQKEMAKAVIEELQRGKIKVIPTFPTLPPVYPIYIQQPVVVPIRPVPMPSQPYWMSTGGTTGQVNKTLSDKTVYNS